MSDIKLKPCPYCGSDNIAVQMSRYRGEADSYYYALCGNCKMAGPEVSNEEGEGIAEEQAAAAWNALPRHLQWTTKTPTEEGWYWNRVAGKKPSRCGYTTIATASIAIGWRDCRTSVG